MEKARGRVSWRWCAIAVVHSLFAAACCCAPAFVAVRETQVRSEEYALPLVAKDRACLLAFLAAGGDRDGVDACTPTSVVYPDAEQRWGGLLDLLGQPDHLAVGDLTNGTYAKWFTGEPIRQIVDARSDRVAISAPYAMPQGRFVWLFVGHSSRLASVFVQQALVRRTETP